MPFNSFGISRGPFTISCQFGLHQWIRTLRLTTLCVVLLFSILLTGCMLVTTYRYIHEPTEKIRAGFFESQYLKKASDALPSNLSGVQLVPEFSHQIGSRANLQGRLSMVARSDHTVTIENITLHDPASGQRHVVQVRESIELKLIKQTNLWYGKIYLQLPSGQFKNLPVLNLDVEWKENDSDPSITTALTLIGETQRSIAFAR